MENITFICRFCGSERKNKNSLQVHECQCKENPDRIKRSKKQTCKICGSIFENRKALALHSIEVHELNLFKGTTPNRSLQTCSFCKKQWYTTKGGLQYHEKYCTQNPKKLKGSGTNRIWTKESKEKVSETQKKNFKESGSKSIWHTQLENRKSFAEQYFDTCFPNLKQNYHVDRYFLDLANPEKKIYIEVDGEQHYNDQKVVEHDKVRTKRLEELGWKCLRRIRWAEYKKLSKEEQESLITELQNQI